MARAIIGSLPAGAASSRGEDVAMMAGASWTIAGLFLDGWAHNQAKPDDFFTPWHAVLYSGYVVTTMCVALIVLRRRPRGPGLSGLLAGAPSGYASAFVGAAAFAVGGVADMAWHRAFGVEVDTAALLSPPHLLLFVAGLAMVSAPLWAAWACPGTCMQWGSHAPGLLSLTLATAEVAFFLMNHTVFRYDLSFTTARYRLFSADDRDFMLSMDQADFLIATMVFVAPALLLLRRWRRPPLGALTLLWTLPALLLGAIDAFTVPWAVAAAAVAGATADVAGRLLSPPAGPAGVWLAGSVLGGLLALAWFGAAWLWSDVALAAEAWAGIVAGCVLVGAGLGLLVAPPAMPAGQADLESDGDVGALAPPSARQPV